MELSIAIIKNNDIQFPILQPNSCTKNNNQISELLKSCVEIRKINYERKNEIISKTADIIEQKEKIDVGMTKIIHDNLDFSYQLLFVDSDKQQRGNYNTMSMYFTRTNNDSEIKIRGNCVLFKINIKTNQIVDITMDDVIEIFLQHYLHTCVKINCDSTLDEVEFIINPLEWMTTEKENYKYYSIELFDKQILIAYDTKNDIINERITKLIGQEAYSICYIVLINDERYFSIDKKIYEKIEHIILNREKLSATDFIYDKEISKQTKKIYNFDMYIDDKYRKITNI